MRADIQRSAVRESPTAHHRLCRRPSKPTAKIKSARYRARHERVAQERTVARVIRCEVDDSAAGRVSPGAELLHRPRLDDLQFGIAAKEFRRRKLCRCGAAGAPRRLQNTRSEER